jgi:hypothetical protein
MAADGSAAVKWRASAALGDVELGLPPALGLRRWGRRPFRDATAHKRIRRLYAEGTVIWAPVVHETAWSLGIVITQRKLREE